MHCTCVYFPLFFDGCFVFLRLSKLNETQDSAEDTSCSFLEGFFFVNFSFLAGAHVSSESSHAELKLWQSSVSERLSNLLANWRSSTTWRIGDSGFDFLFCVLQLLSLLEDLACFGINKVAGIAITGVDVIWLAVIKRFLSSIKVQSGLESSSNSS